MIVTRHTLTRSSYAEIDWLFENKVSARKFASTHVDVFGDTDKHETSHHEKIGESEKEGRHGLV